MGYEITETLFILKPDALKNEELIQNFYCLCEMYKLTVLKIKSCSLTNSQIGNLWGESCCKDYVLRTLLMTYYNEKNVDVVIVKGENCYSKASMIKKMIRSVYAKSWIENCVHSPDNYNEYIKDINILNSGLERNYIDNLKQIDLNETIWEKQDLERAIEYYLHEESKSYYKEKSIEMLKHQYIILIKNYKNGSCFTECMSLLCKSLKGITVLDALMIVSGSFGEKGCLAYATDNYQEAKILSNKLQTLFYVTIRGYGDLNDS